MRGFVARNKKEWEELASLDPLWSILSDPEKRFCKWEVSDFFETGIKEIEAILGKAGSLGYPERRRKVLDFGCGVGRLARGLSENFSEYYGVDISEEMVNLARQFNGNAYNCWFILNPSGNLRIFPDNHFDMVYSNIVLQHLPHTGQIRSYIREFIRLLTPAGLIVFQLASWIPFRNRIQPRRRLYLLLRYLGVDVEFLYRKLGLHPIRMNFMREEEVMGLLKAEGGKILEVLRSGKGGRSFQSCVYFVSK